MVGCVAAALLPIQFTPLPWRYSAGIVCVLVHFAGVLGIGIAGAMGIRGNLVPFGVFLTAALAPALVGVGSSSYVLGREEYVTKSRAGAAWMLSRHERALSLGPQPERGEDGCDFASPILNMPYFIVPYPAATPERWAFLGGVNRAMCDATEPAAYGLFASGILSLLVVVTSTVERRASVARLRISG